MAFISKLPIPSIKMDKYIWNCFLMLPLIMIQTGALFAQCISPR